MLSRSTVRAGKFEQGGDNLRFWETIKKMIGGVSKHRIYLIITTNSCDSYENSLRHLSNITQHCNYDMAFIQNVKQNVQIDNTD